MGRLKERCGRVGYGAGEAVKLEVREPFDLVIITEIIEHVAHPDEFLAQVARLTRPGGYVLLSTPNGGYFLSDRPRFSDTADASQYEAMQFQPDASGHIFLLHADEIRPLAQAAGLMVREIRLFTNALTNGHLKTAMLHRVLPSAVIQGFEWVTRRLPAWITRRSHTAMAVLLQRRSDAVSRA